MPKDDGEHCGGDRDVESEDSGAANLREREHAPRA
jgi:hypothetical protein